MMPLALIRHAPTAWNEEKRLQGQADIPLSENGRDTAAGWRVPARFASYRWVASPLRRTMETATLLDLDFDTEMAITEMDWGAWEGHTMDELRGKYGDEVDRRTARGIDLRPHDGESPREVRERVRDWLLRSARGGDPTGAVTHQGIIRAVLSLATGWDMIRPPPFKMNWSSVHLFNVAEDAAVEIFELNISLEAE